MNLSVLPPVEIGDATGFVRLHRRELDLVQPVVASHGEHRSRRLLIVEVGTGESRGWGECGAPDDATYTGETADAAAAFLADISPSAFAGRALVTATMVRSLVTAIDGDACSRHPMAVAALETAVLDAQLRAAGTAFESLFRTTPKRAAAAGATLGNVPPNGTDASNVIEMVVRHAVEAVTAGYSRLKLKIGPGLHTTELVRELRTVVASDVVLLGDANGSYGDGDVLHVASLGDLGLDIVEQPFAPHDTASHQALVATGAIRVALDEGVRNASDALDALANHECTDVTLKPARFGYLACLEALDRLADHGAGAWIGGMFDTGVARWANVRLAAHSSVTLASDIGASDRYWVHDLTEPVTANAGLVTVPGVRRPGLSGVPLDA
ncbi:MAG: enolase C-terminal domain-like protein [Actinomycetota bacterium]